MLVELNEDNTKEAFFDYEEPYDEERLAAICCCPNCKTDHFLSDISYVIQSDVGYWNSALQDWVPNLSDATKGVFGSTKEAYLDVSIVAPNMKCVEV
jgi:hypothetical protein